MNYDNNKTKQRTVDGRTCRYHIEYDEGISGRNIVGITQEITNLGDSDILRLEPELIGALTDAIRELKNFPPPAGEFQANRDPLDCSEHALDRPTLNPWSFHEDGMLFHFYRDGYSFGEMAKLIGQSAESVEKRIKNLGLLDNDEINAMRAQVSGAASLT